MASEMKLSDAIEAGWKLAPQGWKEGYGARDIDGSWVGVCAVGAAILGAKPEAEEWDLDLKTGGKLFPQLYSYVPVAHLPQECINWFEGEHYTLDLSDVIQFLNDQEHRAGPDIVAYVRKLGY
jgi:hypothetical protein